jgi:cell division protein FtsL
MLQTGPFDKVFIKYRFWLLVFLLACCLLNITSFIYHKHLNRNLHIKLNQLYKAQEQLNTQKSMLILEKSTLESRLRIENVARNKLMMIQPQKIEIVGVLQHDY